VNFFIFSFNYPTLIMQRYLTYFTCTALLIAFLVIPIAILFEPLSGELTRVGGWAERDFGQNVPQPVIKVKENTLINPDIVVLGDSFSAKNLWQSVLSEQLNKKILTFDYNHVGCIDNWINWIQTNERVKIVIIESVERSVVERFFNLKKCSKKQPKPLKIIAKTTNSNRPKWPPTWNIYYLFKTTINTLKMSHQKHSLFRANNVINVPIKNSCAKFSNKQSDRLLYYISDEKKEKLNAKKINLTISNILKIQEQFATQGKTIYFVIAPDKSSVYRDCFMNRDDFLKSQSTNITKQLILSGANTPNLLELFIKNRNNIVDLYMPNDTHWSESGYLLMAKELGKLIMSDDKPSHI
jgi:hypothetical protein